MLRLVLICLAALFVSLFGLPSFASPPHGDCPGSWVAPGDECDVDDCCAAYERKQAALASVSYWEDKKADAWSDYNTGKAIEAQALSTLAVCMAMNIDCGDGTTCDEWQLGYGCDGIFGCCVIAQNYQGALFSDPDGPVQGGCDAACVPSECETACSDWSDALLDTDAAYARYLDALEALNCWEAERDALSLWLAGNCTFCTPSIKLPDDCGGVPD
jgi:hypothetical protein